MPAPQPPIPAEVLVEEVAHRLLSAGATLATAESCTGGRVAALCTRVAGASAWYLEGVVSYSNPAKVRLLGVDPSAIQRHGAVSPEVAIQMARGARERSGSTWGLSTTGIAGPTGGTPDKPVGTVHLAVVGPGASIHRRVRLAGSRHQVQAAAAADALALLLRALDPSTPPA